MSSTPQVPFADHLAAVTRQVVETSQHASVSLEYTYDADIAQVWQALTDADSLAQWFAPVTGTLEEGGEFQLAHVGLQCRIANCEDRSLLVIDWDLDGATSELKIELSQPDPHKTDDSPLPTRLALQHTMDRDQHWATYGPAATGVGWDGAVVNLGLFLKGDERAHPDKAEEFAATSAGQRYIHAITEHWSDTHAAAGADPDDARAAAQATYSFYTGANSE